MNTNFTETVSDLTTRIKIHQQYGTKDIDQWMLNVLGLIPGITILDVGCGTGKQCFLMERALSRCETSGTQRTRRRRGSEALRGQNPRSEFMPEESAVPSPGRCEITGTDVSEALLKAAAEEKKKRKSTVNFVSADFNQALPFPDESFQLVTCCFALYYALDIPFTISEMKRVLAPKGRLFVTGPLPENKEIFYRIIEEATGKPIPFMPGRAKFGSEILDEIRKTFQKTAKHRFENPVIFKEVKPFLDYTNASLSEDRKLWARLFSDEPFDDILQKIKKRAEEEIAKKGQIIMTKVVAGFLATA